MEHPMRRRVVSEGAGLRPGLMGLGIDLFPVYNSPERLAPPTEDAIVRSQTEARLSRRVKGLATEIAPSGKSQLSSKATTTLKAPSQASNAFSMRSHQGMKGLLDAELGGSMVELDLYSIGGGSGFKSGQQIGPNTVTPAMASTATNRPTPRQRSVTVFGGTLSRNNTLFCHEASPSRNAAALKTLLGTSGRKASANAVVPPAVPVPAPGLDASSFSSHRKSASATDLPGALSLEKAKSKARVEIDIELESDTIVEGGFLRGKMQVSIRKATKRESPIWIGGGKMRIVGFEGLPNSDTRYTFYQVADVLSNITSASHHLFASAPDEEGFARAREGTHILPFAMKIPVGGDVGSPKGVIQTRSGISIRYIAMGSIKLTDPNSPVRSIAHFYRNVEIYPYLGPQILAPSEEPLKTQASQGLFMGGSGKVRLTVTLHRRIWVAGQRCYAHIAINNETTKKVKTLTLMLTRTMTTFQPKVELDTASARSPGSADIDACETSTSKKEVATCTLDMGQKGEKGCVTAKGFWTGVQGGSVVELSHFIMVPSDALSISRGRLIEVDYRLTVSASAGSLSSDISVSLPIRIINFLSIDPPPDSYSVTSVAAQTRRPMYQLPGSRSTPNLNRRKSVSMENIDQHDEQLRRWELRHGDQPIQWRALNQNGNGHSQRLMPSSQSDHPIQTASRSNASQIPHSSPQSRHHPQRGYSEPSSPSRSAAYISSPNRSSPTRSAMSQRGFPTREHPERGREIARDMFHQMVGTMTRSKTVAFADEYPQLAQASSQQQPAHRSAPPTQLSFHISTPSFSPQKQPKSQKHARLMRAVSMVEQTPPVMKLTASVAADDEMSDSSSGGSDPDEAIYWKGEESISAVAHDQRGKVRQRMDHSVEERDTSDIEERVVVAPMASMDSLLTSTAEDGDMSRDAGWDDPAGVQLPADQSLDARDLARAVAGRLGEDENLMLAELPIGEVRSRSPSPLRSPLPSIRRPQEQERVPGSQRASPSRTMVQQVHALPLAVPSDLQVRTRSLSPVKSSASYMGRLQSAMVFNGPISSHSTTPLTSPHTNLQPSSYAAMGLPSCSSPHAGINSQRTTTDFFSRTTSQTTALRPNASRTASTPTGFPFPHIGPSAEEDPRWSGVPTTAKITTMSHAAAVMTNIPSSGSSTGSTSRSAHMHSDRESAVTTHLENDHSQTSSQSESSTRPMKISRPGHKSNLSASSVSTESSLVTQSSTTSSSRGMPSSVKSKIAQLEARNRALRAFSTVGGMVIDEEVAGEPPMQNNHSTFTMMAEREADVVGGKHDDLVIDNRTSVTSSVGSAYSDIFQGSRPASMKGGFNSPMFRQMPGQRQTAK
ncbi:hypothetical protein FRB97_009834 [Tulasnella sp. 331]|nr:hypothetical protein FRB97_009834 [Tulasnella sp. 331]